MLRRTLFVIFTLAGCANGAETSDGTESTGALSTTQSVTLIQQGFFHDDQHGPRRVPRLVHVGFADARGGPWEGVRDISVRYSGGASDEVKVDVPQAYRGKKLLLYSIQYDAFSAHDTTPLRQEWISDLVVSLDAPDGQFVTAPVSDGAGYPFAAECYDISVQQEKFAGKLRGIVYGFTKSSKSDYDANNDVPWLDAEGNAKNEGFLPIVHEHDGGYKGAYISLPVWVRVPKGENLVLKASLNRYSGNCLYGDDTREIPPPNGQDSHLTKTYFVEGN